MNNDNVKPLTNTSQYSTPRTGGEYFISILQKLGINYVFGTTGGGMPDIQDAMTEVRPPIWIQSLHEFPSVAASMGYALASEQLAICLIDRTVGTANALGAFYAAYENYAPLVIFASQNLPAVSSGKMPDGSTRTYGVHYHTWQSMLTTPWTKWRYELSNLEMLESSILKALMMAKHEPSGPVYMTLRQDLMAKKIDAKPTPIKKPLRGTVVADKKSIASAVKLLLEAEKPII
jgi:acetolactate synthase-1/2/3 large subunit